MFPLSEVEISNGNCISNMKGCHEQECIRIVLDLAHGMS